MKISKADALMWFRFFAELPEDEALQPWQQEIVYSTLTQLETAVEKRCDALRAPFRAELQTLDGRTDFVGNPKKFPRGCRSCLTGTGLSAIRKTNRCNLNCPFCYDYGVLDQQPPIGEELWEIGGSRFYERDLPVLLKVSNRPTGVSYVYLEPFLEIEKYYGVIRSFHEAGIHQHLYTNGTLANEDNLRALGEAGLDELRFNLGASGCADKVIENIAIAKKYIPHVGVETPMTEAFYSQFLTKKEQILASGPDFINCAELHLNENNIGNYYPTPMYMCRQGYLSPIFSHEIAIKLMRMCVEEQWDICVHDCCNHTKFVRDLNLRAKEGGWFGASSYGCEFDTIPYAALISALEWEDIVFEEEEPLPNEFYPEIGW